jgi:hypothetical protein
VKEINLYTQGWINYYGIGDMKTFISKTAQWLNHRLRQLIWKRWKRVSTRFYGLMRYEKSALGILLVIFRDLVFGQYEAEQ